MPSEQSLVAKAIERAFRQQRVVALLIASLRVSVRRAGNLHTAVARAVRRRHFLRELGAAVSAALFKRPRKSPKKKKAAGREAAAPPTLLPEAPEAGSEWEDEEEEEESFECEKILSYFVYCV